MLQFLPFQTTKEFGNDDGSGSEYEDEDEDEEVEENDLDFESDWEAERDASATTSSVDQLSTSKYDEDLVTGFLVISYLFFNKKWLLLLMKRSVHQKIKRG